MHSACSPRGSPQTSTTLNSPAAQLTPIFHAHPTSAAAAAPASYVPTFKPAAAPTFVPAEAPSFVPSSARAGGGGGGGGGAAAAGFFSNAASKGAQPISPPSTSPAASFTPPTQQPQQQPQQPQQQQQQQQQRGGRPSNTSTISNTGAFLFPHRKFKYLKNCLPLYCEKDDRCFLFSAKPWDHSNLIPTSHPRALSPFSCSSRPCRRSDWRRWSRWKGGG